MQPLSTILIRLAPVFLISILIVLSSGCKISDLRTNYMEINPTGLEGKGQEKLQLAWKKQGLDKISRFESYEVIGKDHWKGLVGSIGKMWPVNNSKMRWRFVVNTFDSQLTILEGKKTNFTAGLQSWKYYEGKDSSNLAFQSKNNKKVVFGLAAFHYFFELADRLKEVPIVKYAGTSTYEGKGYDLVFVTWEKEEPHREHDQYLVYINQDSQKIEIVTYTIRDTYVPGAKSFKATVLFEDFRSIEGDRNAI